MKKQEDRNFGLYRLLPIYLYAVRQRFVPLFITNQERLVICIFFRSFIFIIVTPASVSVLSEQIHSRRHIVSYISILNLRVV